MTNRHHGLESLLGVDMANACDYAGIDATGKSFIRVFDELAASNRPWRQELHDLITTRDAFAAGAVAAPVRSSRKGNRRA